MIHYNDAHRLFLQTFVAKKLLSERDTEQIYEKIRKRLGMDSEVDLLNEFIKTINKELVPLYLEIRAGRAEDSGQKYFALVNSLEDEPSKLATDFNPQEIEFIKKVIEAIVVSPEGFASSTDLLNLCHTLTKKLTANASQDLLNLLSSKNWLCEKKGQVSLGPRSVIELGQYLENKFKEHITVCQMCHTIVVMGDICNHCDVKIHKYCIETRFEGLSADKKKCPACKKTWAANEGEVKNEDVSFTDDQEDGDEEDVQLVSSSSRSKRSRRL